MAQAAGIARDLAERKCVDLNSGFEKFNFESFILDIAILADALTKTLTGDGPCPSASVSTL